MVEWKDITVANLRAIAQFYNKQVKIVGASKMKKADLTAELQKHLNLSGNTFTHKQHNSIKYYLDDVNEPPKAPPAPAVETGDKTYKKKVVAKKVVQARGASADAKAIVPPTVKDATDMVIKKKKSTKASAPPKAPAPPAVATGDKSYKKKVVAKKVVQARGASADAKAIAPSQMEEKKDEQPKGVLASPYDDDITTTKRSDYWEYEVLKKSYDRVMKITKNGEDDPNYIDRDKAGKLVVMSTEDYLKLWNGLISVSPFGGIKLSPPKDAKNFGRSDLELKLLEMKDDLDALDVADSKEWWGKEKKKANAPYFLAMMMNRMVGEIAGKLDEYKWEDYQDHKKNNEYLFNKQIWDKLNDVFVRYKSKAKK